MPSAAGPGRCGNSLVRCSSSRVAPILWIRIGRSLSTFVQMDQAATDQTLPPALAAGLADFARSCKAAARAVSLYPGQHPAIGTSLARLVEATARLTETGPLVLHKHLIGSITVNAGVEAESWRTLLLLLARLPEEVRADGGIAQLWSTAGGPSVEIQEIDYAEVLREKHGAA